MDENTSPVSAPGSENACSPRERFSPLQSKTNKSSYEIKSDGAKKSPSLSPRSPLTGKNASVFTPPYINRQSLKELSPRSASPTDRQRQQQKFQLHTDNKDSDDDTNGRHLKQQQQQQQQATSFTAKHSSPKADSSKSQQQQRALEEEAKVLQQELDALKVTLEAERKHSAWMASFENTMVELANQFKELRADVEDSVDILVESNQIMDELVAEKEMQAQVDKLMNLIPQRLFEIEELKNQQ